MRYVAQSDYSWLKSHFVAIHLLSQVFYQLFERDLWAYNVSIDDYERVVLL